MRLMDAKSAYVLSTSCDTVLIFESLSLHGLRLGDRQYARYGDTKGGEDAASHESRLDRD